ncbi:MAG: hemolysin family protein [Bacillota bacterium]|nr:hemolysin family protein [Bacillota bacterium]
MNAGQWVQLAMLAACLVMVGLCCAAEAAYVSVNRATVRAIANEGIRRAIIADRLLGDRTGLLAQLLVGVNVFTVGASVLSASLAHEIWGPVGLAVTAPALVVFILIFAEITPKQLAYGDPTGAAMWLAPLVGAISTAFRPVAAWFTSLPLWLARSSALGSEGIDVTPETLEELLRMGEEHGSLRPETGDIVLGIILSGSRAVREVMTPRDSVVMIDASTPVSAAAAIVAEANLSRLPVFDRERDRIMGVVHVKDVAARLFEGSEVQVGQITRPVLRAPDSTPTRTLLAEMRRKRQHMAVVTDHAGKLAGLVTMQDLLEEIVGEVAGPATDDS